MTNPNPFGNSNGVAIKNLYEKKDIVFDALRSYVFDKDDKQLLVVKQFPAGNMDMSALRAYFSQLRLTGFYPDLVIIDYVGEMKDYPGMPTWEGRQKLVRDLRGFAVEEQVCVLTAMQADARSREAMKLGGVIEDENLAEAKGQARPLDALWSINQLQEEKECGLARIYVNKHRDGPGKFFVHIEIDYNTLKVRQVSKNYYEKTRKEYMNKKDVLVVDDMKRTTEQQVDQIVRSKFNDVGYTTD